MAPHITAHDPVVSCEGGHPVIPELGAAADAMLEPHCLLFGHPGIGVVVDLVVHFAIIGSDFRHTLLLSLGYVLQPARRVSLGQHVPHPVDGSKGSSTGAVA